LLEEKLRAVGFVEDADHSVETFESPEKAYAAALEQCGENDRIVVFGSFFTVAGVMSHRKLQRH
jgi:dihydrofolate synthase/folylpolyglutamate synthase